MSLKFLNSGTSLGNKVGVGVSSIVGPTGSMGVQGPVGIPGTGSISNPSWIISPSGSSFMYQGSVVHNVGMTGSTYLWNNPSNLWDFNKIDSRGIDQTSFFTNINNAVDLNPNNVYLTITEGFFNYGTYKVLSHFMGTASFFYGTEYVSSGYYPNITTGAKLEVNFFVKTNSSSNTGGFSNWTYSTSGTAYSGIITQNFNSSGGEIKRNLWFNTGTDNIWIISKYDNKGVDNKPFLMNLNNAVELNQNGNIYLTVSENEDSYGVYRVYFSSIQTDSCTYYTSYVYGGETPYINTGASLQFNWFVEATTGPKGEQGQGFKVFSTTSSYTGLNSIIATGGNVGEFVLVTGGDLFVYMGTGAGSTGPDNSYEYAGDVTDESKLVGVQGPQGEQGLQGLIGYQGLKGDGGSLPTGTYYGDYLYWNQSLSKYSVGSENIVIGQNAGATLQQINAVAIGLAAGTSLQGTGSIAIGRQSGQNSQGEYSVSMGYNAGGSNQKSKSISIGYVSGQTNQQSNSIAIGTSSGNINQMDYSVALGFNAGSYAQNSYSVGIGYGAGQNNQATGCIAIGYKAGTSGQSQTSIAIGDSAGFTSQGITSVAIGTIAGYNSQGRNAVAIGRNVGYSFQGENSIAIGNNAGVTNQAAYSIIINTTGTLNANTGGFYVNPIRRDITSFNLFYNPTTREITYFTGGAGTQGPQGLVGDVGAQGLQGLVGNNGAQGFQGVIGITGSNGTQGAQGPAGGGGAGSSQWISSTGGIIYYSSGSVGINKANPTGSLDVVGNVSITGALNLTGNLVNPTLQNYRETVNLATTTSTTYVVNCNTGNNFQVTLSTGTTFSFINVAPTGTLVNINLFLTQDSTGNRTVTWPSSVSWGNPGAPILSTSGGSTDILSFSTFTGGSKIFGFMSGRGF